MLSQFLLSDVTFMSQLGRSLFGVKHCFVWRSSRRGCQRGWSQMTSHPGLQRCGPCLCAALVSDDNSHVIKQVLTYVAQNKARVTSCIQIRRISCFQNCFVCLFHFLRPRSFVMTGAALLCKPGT